VGAGEWRRRRREAAPLVAGNLGSNRQANRWCKHGLAVEEDGGSAGSLGEAGETLSQSSGASNGLFVQPGDRTATAPIAAKGQADAVGRVKVAEGILRRNPIAAAAP